jgi:hypothetical protein
MALIAAVAVGCGTLLSVDDDDAPAPVSPDAAVDGVGATDGPSSGEEDDGAVIPLEPLPGTDGSADDGAAIPADATADTLNPPNCPGTAACERVVFVTSAPGPSSIVNRVQANALCTAAAADTLAHPRILNRVFVAWISDGADDDPFTHFVKSSRPYIRPDGTIIAANWAVLIGGQLLKASIFHDQRGNSVGGGAQVWTGTVGSGKFSKPNCAAWTSNLADDRARVGVVGATNANWTSFNGADASCAEQRRLYCFEL